VSAGHDLIGDLKAKTAEYEDSVNILKEAINAAKIQSEIERVSPKSELQEYMEKVQLIVNALFDGPAPKFKFTFATEKVTVELGGDTLVERDYTLEAGTEPAEHWKMQIFADKSAAPVAWLREIDFTLTENAPADLDKKIVYVPIRNEDHVKEVCIFFIPPIQPGETRRFRVSYFWRGFSADLLKTGRTTFFENYKTCDEADTAWVTSEIRFRKSLGDIILEPVGPLPTGSQFLPMHDENYWGWRFANRAMPMDKARLEFTAWAIKETPDNQRLTSPAPRE
jgi:hypothetical protein